MYYKLRNENTGEFISVYQYGMEVLEQHGGDIRDLDGEGPEDMVFTNVIDAHFAAYDFEEDGIVAPISVVAFDESGVEYVNC